jgi:hypothetical protein
MGDPRSTNLSPNLANHSGQPSWEASGGVAGRTWSTRNLFMSSSLLAFASIRQPAGPAMVLMR